MVEQADTRDLKSLGGDFVPVQIRSSAPVGGLPYGRKKIRRVFLVCFFTPRYCRAAKVPKTRTVRNKNARRRIWLTRVHSSLFRRKLLTNPVIGYPRRLALRPQKNQTSFSRLFFLRHVIAAPPKCRRHGQSEIRTLVVGYGSRGYTPRYSVASSLQIRSSATPDGLPYGRKKNQTSFSRLFFYATLLPRRQSAEDMDSPKYGSLKAGRGRE